MATQMPPDEECCLPSSRPHGQKLAPPHHPRGASAVVAEIVGQHGKALCNGSGTLRNAAVVLMLTDRTAGIVAGSQGGVLGAITENDILQAYSTGTPGDHSVGAWLLSERARMPGVFAQALSVGARMEITEAARMMRAQSSGDLACRHLLVKDEAGHLQGILSALDLARAVCSLSPESELRCTMDAGTVSQVMKPSGVIPACRESATMGEAVEKMVGSRQNCILVTDGPQHFGVMGVFTTRDALRAFAEEIPLDVEIGHWMFCLNHRMAPRIVAADAPLTDAAAKMASGSVHHLIAVAGDTGDVVGVMSSSDLAHAIGAPERTVGCSC